jgi:hypothetical protein
MRLLAAIYSIICFLGVLPAHADYPMPTETVPASASEITVEAYIFNISGWTLIPSNQDVTDNDKPLVSLPRKSYQKVYLSSGSHDLRIHGRKLLLDAIPGQKYYIVMGYRPERSWAFQLAGDSVVIRQITEEEAKPLFRELKENN